MGLPPFPAPPRGRFPFRRAQLAPFLEDLFHEIISGKGPARAAPILGVPGPLVIGKQGGDLPLQGRHPFFKRRSGHV